MEERIREGQRRCEKKWYEEPRRVNFKLPDDVHFKFQRICAEKRLTMQDQLEELVEKFCLENTQLKDLI